MTSKAIITRIWSPSADFPTLQHQSSQSTQFRIFCYILTYLEKLSFISIDTKRTINVRTFSDSNILHLLSLRNIFSNTRSVILSDILCCIIFHHRNGKSIIRLISPSFNNPAFLDDLAAIVLQEQAMKENTIRDVQLSRQNEH